MTYFYHGTVSKNLPSIARQGLHAPYLRPNRVGLFITNNEEAAKDWAKYAHFAWWNVWKRTSDSGEPIILRFDRVNIKSVLEEDRIAGGEGNFIIDETIHPQFIEVYTGGRWIPIKEYVRGMTR